MRRWSRTLDRPPLEVKNVDGPFPRGGAGCRTPTPSSGWLIATEGDRRPFFLEREAPPSAQAGARSLQSGAISAAATSKQTESSKSQIMFFRKMGGRG